MRAAHRLLTVCVGTLLAADAGLLGRRQVTTHHEHLETLAALAPQAQVCANRVFVVDGPVWSSAGITAGIDLALHCIGDVCGDAVAAAVAETMVVFQRRGADDPQRSPLLDGRNHLHPAVHRVQNAVCERPGHDWDVPALAAVAHVTPRHLARLFKDHAGVSPRDYVERIRSGLAEQAIARGLPTAQAVEIAGFGTDRQLAPRAGAARRGRRAASDLVRPALHPPRQVVDDGDQHVEVGRLGDVEVEAGVVGAALGVGPGHGGQRDQHAAACRPACRAASARRRSRRGSAC